MNWDKGDGNGNGNGNGNMKLEGGNRKGARRDFKEQLIMMLFVRGGTQAAGKGCEDEDESIEGGKLDEELDESEEDGSLWGTTRKEDGPKS